MLFFLPHLKKLNVLKTVSLFFLILLIFVNDDTIYHQSWKSCHIPLAHPHIDWCKSFQFGGLIADSFFSFQSTFLNVGTIFLKIQIWLSHSFSFHKQGDPQWLLTTYPLVESNFFSTKYAISRFHFHELCALSFLPFLSLVLWPVPTMNSTADCTAPLITTIRDQTLWACSWVSSSKFKGMLSPMKNC